MFQILPCVVFFVAASINFSVAKRTTTIAQVFEKYGCVPDVIERGPYSPCFIKYPSGAMVKEGNELTPDMVRDVPSVIMFHVNPLQHYTLAMIDPDAPSGMDPNHSEWQHWLVGNIVGNIVASGDTLSGYIGPNPAKGTGLHRYVFLIFRQPGHLHFNEPRLTHTFGEYRGGFSISKFAAKYNLGDPVAGNLFLSQYSG